MEVGCAHLGRWIGMFDLFRILKSLRLSIVPQPPKRTGILEKIAACCVASSLSHPDSIMFFQVPYECNNHQTQYPSL
jgi:hypothetical protein